MDSQPSRPLNIGYLVQQFPPEIGAGAARVSEMALEWVRAGCSVTVITAMPNRPSGYIQKEYQHRWFLTEHWEGVRVLRSWLYVSPGNSLIRVLANNVTFTVSGALHALARSPRPDVLIASSPPFFPHLAGYFLSRCWRVPLILELRDLWPDYLEGMGVFKRGSLVMQALFSTERFLLVRAARAIVVTESFRKRLISKGVEASRISLIPNGVDSKQYFPAPSDPPLESLIRCGANDFIVGYLGNFGAGQGLCSVLEAARILENEPGLRFVLAGDGPDKANLVKKLDILRLKNLSVHAPIAKEKTRDFYNACDVCLVPLAPVSVFQETIPSKIFEIMACGCPVIACLDGEGKRIVETSEGGTTVPPGDPQALAQAIIRMKSLPPEKRSSMGQKGQRFVTENYDRKQLATAYLEYLRLVHMSVQEG